MIPTSTGSSFHFCLYIESLEKDEERGSFLTGNQPFAEVYVKLRHPTDNTAASCSELAFSATTTASIYYGIYWSRGKVATGLDYGRYLGAFDASR